jgi:hypothetical protein
MNIFGVPKLEHFCTVPVLFQILGSESQEKMSCRNFLKEKIKWLIETQANLTFFYYIVSYLQLQLYQ